MKPCSPIHLGRCIYVMKWYQASPFPSCPLQKGRWQDLGTSGVARLGHTGARALATRSYAPPVQVFIRIIGAESTVVNHESGSKMFSNRTAQYCYVYPQNYESRKPTDANLLYKYTALRYGLRTVLGGCNILGKCSPDLSNTSALGAEICLKVVCPCCALASAMS